MFQNLASYLLGYSTNQTEGGLPAATEGVENNANTRLTAKEAEDDWIFVDQHDGEDSLLFDEELKHQDDSDILVVEDGTEDGCGDLGGAYDTISDAAASMVSSGGVLMSSTRSLSSLPGAASAVEESWFLTPPRCFISTGPPVNMATSPLENLLIEHPSMSVYSDHTSSARREPEWFSPISDPSSEAEEDDDDLKGETLVLEDYPLDMGFHIMDNRLLKPAKYNNSKIYNSLIQPYDDYSYYQGTARNKEEEKKSKEGTDFIMVYVVARRMLEALRLLTPNFTYILDEELDGTKKYANNIDNALYSEEEVLRIIRLENKARLLELERQKAVRPAMTEDVVDTNRHIDHNMLPEPQFKQVVALKRAQKVQVKKSRKAKSKGHMERNNKAREVNCRNRRQRRGERSQGPNRSHANNNRKC